MWLIRNGVDEELAWSLSRPERLARAVVFAEFEGAEYDWRAMKFKERKD